MLWYAASNLLIDDAVDTFGGIHNTDFIIRGILVKTANVEPTRHAIAAIHGDGLLVGGGEDGVNVVDGWQRKGGGPSVAGVAKPVQEDHGGRGVGSGGYRDAGAAAVHGECGGDDVVAFEEGGGGGLKEGAEAKCGGGYGDGSYKQRVWGGGLGTCQEGSLAHDCRVMQPTGGCGRGWV